MSNTKENKLMKLCATLIICLLCIVNIYSLPVSAVASDLPVIRSVNGWSVPAGSTKQSSTGVYLYPGDIVYFDFTYTPSHTSMSFGLLTPSNTFKLFNTAGSGIAKSTITITEEGVYKFRVRNNSSSYDATINGKYYTGCSYPFRSPYVAKKISTSYTSSHYGLDIVATTPGAIEGYPIYSIQKGTVEVAEFSASAGYYVVIIGDNGYTSRYLHMQDTLEVNAGDNVTYTTLLGYVGNSGISTGPHLHIDVNTVNGTAGESSGGTINYNTTIDPESLFPQISFTY